MSSSEGIFLFVFFSSRFLVRVLRVGYFGHVGVSRDRIEIPETVRAIGVLPRSARVLNVGCFDKVSVSICRGLHCKPAVPTLFSCLHVDRNITFSSAPSGGRAMRAPTPRVGEFRAVAIKL